MNGKTASAGAWITVERSTRNVFGLVAMAIARTATSRTTPIRILISMATPNEWVSAWRVRL